MKLADRVTRTRGNVWMPAAAAAAVVLVHAATGAAFAFEPRREPAKETPCAILGKYEGDVQILDPTRTQVIETREKGAVPCGAWVSVKEGWAELRHRQGFEFKLGPETFVEVFDNVKDRHLTGNDHLVLYRGKSHVLAPNGDGELRVVTPNGRVRMTDAVALVIFSKPDEETQLIALEKSAILENRYESRRTTRVQAGEATSLNFKAMRIIPSMSAAIDTAALKAQLSDLPLSGRERKTALGNAYARAQRKFPVMLAGDKGETNDKKEPSPRRQPPGRDGGIELSPATRRPASLAASEFRDSRASRASRDSDVRYSYERHPARPSRGRSPAAGAGSGGAEREPGRSEWVRKLAGGSDAGERIMFPDRYYGRRQNASVIVHDPQAGKGNQGGSLSEEEIEKRRLIEELSKIRSY